LRLRARAGLLSYLAGAGREPRALLERGGASAERLSRALFLARPRLVDVFLALGAGRPGLLRIVREVAIEGLHAGIGVFSGEARRKRIQDRMPAGADLRAEAGRDAAVREDEQRLAAARLELERDLRFGHFALGCPRIGQDARRLAARDL